MAIGKQRSREVMPGVFRISLPLRGEKPGPVKAYLFIGDTVSLIDTGTLGAAPVLKTQLQACGIEFSDIDQVIITHGHIDHYGAANRIAAFPGARARVAVHAADAHRVETGADISRKTYNRFLRLMGVPLGYRMSINLMSRMFRSMAENCKVDFFLEDGMQLQLGNYKGTVITTPGHSKGSVCIYLENERVLFSGDHILGHITPNAFVMLEEPNPLPQRSSQMAFYDAIEKVEKLSPKRIFPAHGGIITDLFGTTRMYRDNFVERESRIHSIASGGLFTVYQIARSLFPKIGGRRLPLDIYLAVSEVYSHLEVLLEKGKIDIDTDVCPVRVRVRANL